jgi:pimeloyl-ACP methyl ester carboxylesterase
MTINKLHIYRGIVTSYIVGLLVWSYWYKVLFQLFIIYCAVCALMWAFQRSLIYHSYRNVRAPQVFGLTDVEVKKLTAADGVSFQAWVHPAAEGRATVVVFHGNAGSLEHRVPLLRGLADLGFGYVAIDYRGFGNSEGSPSEQGFYSDARETMRYILEDLHIPLNSVSIMGESIGTGVAVQMATEYRVSSLFLQSPYTSLPDVAAGSFFWLPVHWLMEDRFENITKIGSVDMPVFVLHGERDSTIPVSHGRKILATAKEPKESAFLTDVGHNDFNVLDVLVFMDGFVTKYTGIDSPR